MTNFNRVIAIPEWKPGNTITVEYLLGPATVVPPPIVSPPVGRDWDPRLDALGVKLVPATAASGQPYWRLIKAHWLDEAESQGRHHIFYDVIGENNERLLGVKLHIHNSGDFYTMTEIKAGEPYSANFPMFGLLGSYDTGVSSGIPSDRVTGLGLGTAEQPKYAIHTSCALIFRLTRGPS